MPQGSVNSPSARGSDVAADTGPSTDSTSNDDRALGLRREGKGYRTIADELQLQGPIDAITAFNRALRRRPVHEQAVIRAEEESRLDSLADAVRRNDELSPEGLDHRLRAIDRVRAALMSE
jgi:hypothetical protein